MRFAIHSGQNFCTRLLMGAQKGELERRHPAILELTLTPRGVGTPPAAAAATPQLLEFASQYSSSSCRDQQS
jgi:hypothetical protein